MTREGGSGDAPSPKIEVSCDDVWQAGNRAILWASASLLVLCMLAAWAAIAEPAWVGTSVHLVGALLLGGVLLWWLCVTGVAVSHGRWWTLIVLPGAVLPVVVVGAFLVSCFRGHCI